jgi:GTP-binding protein LepA
LLTRIKIHKEAIIVNNPSDLPEPSKLNRVEEPFIKASIVTKSDFVGQVMSLCIEKRGTNCKSDLFNNAKS